MNAIDNSMNEEQTPLVRSSEHEDGKSYSNTIFLIFGHNYYAIHDWLGPEKDESSDDSRSRLSPEDYEITEKFEMVRNVSWNVCLRNAAFYILMVLLLL